MDEYSGKRTARVGSVRRGPSLSFRDPNHDDRSIQYCNRLGCSARFNSMKGTHIDHTENLKLSRPPIRSTSSKNTAGSSSKPFSASSDLKKSHQETRNQASLQETVIVKSNSKQEQREDFESSRKQKTATLESSSTTTKIETTLPESEDLESAILQGLSANATEASGSCTVASHSRPGKQLNWQHGSSYQDMSSSYSARRSFRSKNAIQAMKPASQGQISNAQRYGLRNLRCGISDVFPSGCSSSDSGHDRSTDALRKRSSDGESSSARGKGTNESLNGGNSGSLRSSLPGPSSSLSESPLPQPASRRTRNRPTNKDGVVSVRTQRVSSGDARMRLSEHGDDNTFSLPEPLLSPQLPQNQYFIPEAASASSLQSSPTELPPICPSTFERPGSSNGITCRRPVAPSEDSSTRMIRGPLVDRDGYRHFNMEGIAEVLSALERIEQVEELTYEQLLVLESNLFLGGLGFHDQHRDMRLDIDNMSYEELLALEEKMGTVSTALTEEALSKCLKRSIYMRASLISGNTGYGGDDVKCSICQEEYIAGDEVGKLGCDHRYHVVCIHQWLQQKNWCPICKVPASPL